jgi:hypothetical protein
VSLSPDLIEAAVGALPLLMSPLSLPVSHDSETLHGKEEINVWWDKFLTRYHLALITEQNQAESRSMRRAGRGAGGGGRGGRGIARSSSSNTMRVTSASCRSWLVGMSSIDFYNSQMLKDLSYHDCKCAEALCVFDLDTLTVSIMRRREGISFFLFLHSIVYLSLALFCLRYDMYSLWQCQCTSLLPLTFFSHLNFFSTNKCIIYDHFTLSLAHRYSHPFVPSFTFFPSFTSLTSP